MLLLLLPGLLLLHPAQSKMCWAECQAENSVVKVILILFLQLLIFLFLT